jgi:hypothetical protein
MPFRPPLLMYHADPTGWIVVNLILKNTMYIIMSIFTYTCSQNTTICQMVSLCNLQQYVIYNYIFRPCKWAIIRFFVELVSWLYSRSLGGGGAEISSYIISCEISIGCKHWMYGLSRKECFLIACICEYTHNYIHCIIDLTQRGWHTLRLYLKWLT